MTRRQIRLTILDFLIATGRVPEQWGSREIAIWSRRNG